MKKKAKIEKRNQESPQLGQSSSDDPTFVNYSMVISSFLDQIKRQHPSLDYCDSFQEIVKDTSKHIRHNSGRIPLAAISASWLKLSNQLLTQIEIINSQNQQTNIQHKLSSLRSNIHHLHKSGPIDNESSKDHESLFSQIKKSISNLTHCIEINDNEQAILQLKKLKIDFSRSYPRFFQISNVEQEESERLLRFSLRDIDGIQRLLSGHDKLIIIPPEIQMFTKYLNNLKFEKKKIDLPKRSKTPPARFPIVSNAKQIDIKANPSVASVPSAAINSNPKPIARQTSNLDAQIKKAPSTNSVMRSKTPPSRPILMKTIANRQKQRIPKRSPFDNLIFPKRMIPPKSPPLTKTSPRQPTSNVPQTVSNKPPQKLITGNRPKVPPNTPKTNSSQDKPTKNISKFTTTENSPRQTNEIKKQSPKNNGKLSPRQPEIKNQINEKSPQIKNKQDEFNKPTKIRQSKSSLIDNKTRLANIDINQKPSLQNMNKNTKKPMADFKEVQKETEESNNDQQLFLAIEKAKKEVNETSTTLSRLQMDLTSDELQYTGENDEYISYLYDRFSQRLHSFDHFLQANEKIDELNQKVKENTWKNDTELEEILSFIDENSILVDFLSSDRKSMFDAALLMKRINQDVRDHINSNTIFASSEMFTLTLNTENEYKSTLQSNETVMESYLNVLKTLNQIKQTGTNEKDKSDVNKLLKKLQSSKKVFGDFFDKISTAERKEEIRKENKQLKQRIQLSKFLLNEDYQYVNQFDLASLTDQDLEEMTVEELQTLRDALQNGKISPARDSQNERNLSTKCRPTKKQLASLTTVHNQLKELQIALDSLKMGETSAVVQGEMKTRHEIEATIMDLISKEQRILKSIS